LATVSAGEGLSKTAIGSERQDVVERVGRSPAPERWRLWPGRSSEE